MTQALVQFDTDHIKSYVFGTDNLPEIRGASSLLDRLNRQIETIGKRFEAKPIFANGGSGIFLVDTKKAEEFGYAVQKEYRKESGGGASITFACQALPESWGDDKDEILKRSDDNTPNKEVGRYIQLAHIQLNEAKGHPPEVISLPTHPFMRPCNSCGMEYASNKKFYVGATEPYFCDTCVSKRDEDFRVKRQLRQKQINESLWKKLIEFLRKTDDNGLTYNLATNSGSLPARPSDFNIFRKFEGGKKGYMGLIYADANGMGQLLKTLKSLNEYKKLAGIVDTSVYEAVAVAIKKHLPIETIVDEQDNQDEDEEQLRRDEKHKLDEAKPTFPFDVLLLGGDDIVIVVPAEKAMTIAHTIATTFHDLTRDKFAEVRKKQKEWFGDRDAVTLSLGVTIAPVKYPFRPQLDMAETAMKEAKKTASKSKIFKDRLAQKLGYKDTAINFMTIIGNSNQYNTVIKSLKNDGLTVSGTSARVEATLRPYTPEMLEYLLGAIIKGHRIPLARTKLHQISEAVMHLNLTTSVSDSLAILINWREKERNPFIDIMYGMEEIWKKAGQDIIPTHPFQHALPLFPWLSPWEEDFVDKDDKNKRRKIYQTFLLDYEELYNFVGEDGERATSN